METKCLLFWCNEPRDRWPNISGELYKYIWAWMYICDCVDKRLLTRSVSWKPFTFHIYNIITRVTSEQFSVCGFTCLRLYSPSLSQFGNLSPYRSSRGPLLSSEVILEISSKTWSSSWWQALWHDKEVNNQCNLTEYIPHLKSESEV